MNKAYKELEKENQPQLVFYTGQELEAPEETKKFKESKSDNVKIVHFDNMVSEDVKVADLKSDVKPKPDDLALIMYTSGSTGTPKGVELTNANIIAAMGAAEYLVIELVANEDHTYIGFLPLAHVLEFLIEFIMISLGIPIGYGSIRTLMNDFVCKANGEGKGEGDLQALKPTIMAGVPAVWEKIKKGVEKQLDRQHWTIKKAFEGKLQLTDGRNTIVMIFVT